jgi:hypothetical protein
MVFIVVVIIVLVVCCSCTEHTRARRFGGEETVTLPSGMKLLEVTWKEGNNLWYLLEPMDSNYIPKTKIFKKDSKSGMREYTVKFIECR